MAIVGSQYCAPSPVELTFTRKPPMSLDDGAYEITNDSGDLVFKADSYGSCGKDMRVLLDIEGDPVVVTCKKVVESDQVWQICKGNRCNETVICYIKKSTVPELETSLDVILAPYSNQEDPDFRLVGDFSQRQVVILQGGKVIAEVKQNSITEIKQVVEVSAGVDQALVAALVMASDAIHED